MEVVSNAQNVGMSVTCFPKTTTKLESLFKDECLELMELSRFVPNILPKLKVITIQEKIAAPKITTAWNRDFVAVEDDAKLGRPLVATDSASRFRFLLSSPKRTMNATNITVDIDTYVRNTIPPN